MENQELNKNETEDLTHRIVRLSGDVFRAIKVSVPPEWLSSDLTLAQLRVLLLLHTEGPSRMSAIAQATGATLPTITGTVDLLVKKGLVVRRDDPSDRRLVITELSPAGKAMMGKMWSQGEEQMEKLLGGLSREELEKAKEVALILLRNVNSQAAIT